MFVVQPSGIPPKLRPRVYQHSRLTQSAVPVMTPESPMDHEPIKHEHAIKLKDQGYGFSEAENGEINQHGKAKLSKGDNGWNKSRLLSKSGSAIPYNSVKHKASARLSTASPQTLFQFSLKEEVQDASEFPAGGVSQSADVSAHASTHLDDENSVDEIKFSSQSLLRALSRYRPQGLVERRWQLSRVCPYNPWQFHTAAQAVINHPDRSLSGLTVQQLAYIMAAYATSRHPAQPAFYEHLGDRISYLMMQQAQKTAEAAALGEVTVKGSDVGSGGRSLTLRSVSAAAAACARLGIRHTSLFATLSAWMKGMIRGRALKPRSKDQGGWLSMTLWSFTQLRLYDKKLWQEVSQLLQSEPHWLSLLDANDSLRIAWACTMAHHQDAVLMYSLQSRLVTQVGKLSMLDIGNAWSVLASMSWAPQTVVSALVKASTVKVNSLPPPVLVKTLIALAAMHKNMPKHGSSDQINKLESGGQTGLSQEQLKDFLDELVLWSSNKMMNFSSQEASAALHALSSLRYQNVKCLDRICHFLVHPRWRLLARMSRQQLSVTLQSLAALHHYHEAVTSTAAGLIVQRSQSYLESLIKTQKNLETGAHVFSQVSHIHSSTMRVTIDEAMEKISEDVSPELSTTSVQDPGPSPSPSNALPSHGLISRAENYMQCSETMSLLTALSEALVLHRHADKDLNAKVTLLILQAKGEAESTFLPPEDSTQPESRGSQQSVSENRSVLNSFLSRTALAFGLLGDVRVSHELLHVCLRDPQALALQSKKDLPATSKLDLASHAVRLTCAACLSGHPQANALLQTLPYVLHSAETMTSLSPPELQQAKATSARYSVWGVVECIGLEAFLLLVVTAGLDEGHRQRALSPLTIKDVVKIKVDSATEFRSVLSAVHGAGEGGRTEQGSVWNAELSLMWPQIITSIRGRLVSAWRRMRERRLEGSGVQLKALADGLQSLLDDRLEVSNRQHGHLTQQSEAAGAVSNAAIVKRRSKSSLRGSGQALPYAPKIVCSILHACDPSQMLMADVAVLFSDIKVLGSLFTGYSRRANLRMGVDVKGLAVLVVFEDDIIRTGVHTSTRGREQAVQSTIKDSHAHIVRSKTGSRSEGVPKEEEEAEELVPGYSMLSTVAALRVRILSELGWMVVLLPAREWAEKDKGGAQRVMDFLSALIF
ncbi:hypothetical protein CEUSTIGMA_g97.t1 [Chlamydomonas eustigma]|uniref:RAP domain-containing protein n=1 Tax=Chlamydomonas eustigma TaxID=1157962 RepID=A0A250WPC6_9CHLO|nr:hypothetical protein CEUSTIGMA_g97.t1 [Chlamydomonas eustigma]|eukprot:GAX72641.1 hypothetical protein CEUSTIGMA_g97.t1 [Chlamydomonas eustigma]